MKQFSSHQKSVTVLLNNSIKDTNNIFEMFMLLCIIFSSFQ